MGMMAKPIDLPNGRSGKTQTAALAHFNDMLGRATTPPSRRRSDQVSSTFPGDENVGEMYSTRGFWVHSPDGTDTDLRLTRSAGEAADLPGTAERSLAAELSSFSI